MRRTSSSLNVCIEHGWSERSPVDEFPECPFCEVRAQAFEEAAESIRDALTTGLLTPGRVQLALDRIRALKAK